MQITLLQNINFFCSRTPIQIKTRNFAFCSNLEDSGIEDEQGFVVQWNKTYKKKQVENICMSDNKNPVQKLILLH